MIAFRDSTEKVMLEATDSAESKASADGCVVRRLNVISLFHQWSKGMTLHTCSFDPT